MLRHSSGRALRCTNCFRNSSFLERGNIHKYQKIAAALLYDHPRTRSVQPTSYGRPPPPARYGGRSNVTLIPGDGLGPELTSAVKKIFGHAGVPVDFEELHVSGMDKTVFQDNLDDVITSIKRNSVALKGNIHTPIDIIGFRSINVELRTKLDLFANVVRCKSVSGLTTRHKNVDLVIIRENTEGEYSQLEHENVSGVVESFKIITEEKSLRIARYAFEYATEHNRKKVTAIHKANIMKLADGLFLKCCQEVSKEYPNIEFESMIIDNTAMQLVSKPEQFDVMVMPNLYGNIITNIGAALVGGPGIIPGENIGENFAVFETGTRNTGKGLVGKNISNPVSMLFASTLLLEHLGLHYHCEAISSAVLKILAEGKVRTPDLGGTSTTSDMIDAIMSEIDRSYSYAML